MPTAALTSKGQVTIPKEVREHLGVDSGHRLSFVIQDDGTVVVRPVTRGVAELAGLLHRPGRSRVSLRQMDEGIGRRMRRKYGRRK